MADVLNGINPRSGAGVKDVPAQDFVRLLAAHLKNSGKLEIPAWADLVKMSKFKEMPPIDPDWYYVRAGEC
jgi:small subunit ribosomal protein S19e